MLSEPVAVTLQVTAALEKLGVPYYLRRWAATLAVSDLLELALSEATL